jgi:hypothetical protein
MKKFLNYLKESAWVIYLGGILSVAELYANDYKWWIIVLPTILLNEFLNNNNK